MPIFVSRFSPERVAGANLQRTRGRGNEREDRSPAAAVRDRGQSERGQEIAPGQSAQTRSRDDFPIPTQQADEVRSRLQVGEDRTQPSTARSADLRPSVTGRPASPGVGLERTRADRDVERPGRLGEDRANSAVAQALSRFEGLRTAAQRSGATPAGNGRTDGPAARGAGNAAPAGRQVDPAVVEAQDRFDRLRTVAREGRPAGRATNRSGLLDLPTVQSRETPALDRERDASIRLVANASRQAGLEAFREIDDTAPPTAEQISRANTTEEIRENLQAEGRAVERGLLRDADVQARATTRQTVENAGRVAEARQDREIQTNTSETRELRTQERRLERELVQTERAIRQRQTETSRVQSRGNPAAAAAALGSGVNILAA